MLSPDNYVHAGLGSQGYNRYSYAGNNPLRYVDPSGEVPAIVGIAAMALAGAAIGGASSGIMYAIHAGSDFNGGDFWKSVGRGALVGAISGAISGGIGALAATPSAVAPNIAFGIIRNSASNIAAQAILGNDISLGTVAAGAIGGVLNGVMPGFHALDAGAFDNIAAEMIHTTVMSASIGAVAGGIGAAIDGRDIARGVRDGALGGAISAGLYTAFSIGLWGPTFDPGSNYGYEGKYPPLYRSGGIAGLLSPSGCGITLGRMIWVNKYKQKYPATAAGMTRGDLLNLGLVDRSFDGLTVEQANQYLLAHETYHYMQIVNNGATTMYSNTVSEFLINKFTSKNTYATPGYYEYAAELYGYGWVGYR